jgi:phosphoglucosamine mutase
MRTLFGTDGIRAVAGVDPLDTATIYAIGLALAQTLGSSNPAPRVLLGMDTRESGPWIAATLAAGLVAGGASVESSGIVTTPAVAYIAHTQGFAAGVVISASHNPWQDNGIKIFGADGYKLADDVELAIEREIFHHRANSTAPDPAILTAPVVNPKFALDYLTFLHNVAPGLDLKGQKIVVDCANGAAYLLAQQLFATLGGDVRFTHAEPTGRNINENCGALHAKVVAAETAAQSADIGITFDGDADRCLLADVRGNVVNGDAILLMAARDLANRGILTDSLVVATTMSNMGLEAALKRNGIRMLRAPVGDKYVLEQMQKHNAALGGEQSGHILLPHLATTGDGLLTALVILDLVARTGKPIHELCADLKVYPQVIVNVRVREKLPLEDIPTVAAAIRAAEAELAETGRVVIRYSGTEPLARVMIEAESEATMRHHSEAIASAIRAELGV